MPSALDDLLGCDGARELLARWPSRPHVQHRALDELPAALRDPLLLDPSRLTRVYRGVVEVTSGRGRARARSR